jgi:hypothetical protein
LLLVSEKFWVDAKSGPNRRRRQLLGAGREFIAISTKNFVFVGWHEGYAASLVRNYILARAAGKERPKNLAARVLG